MLPIKISYPSDSNSLPKLDSARSYIVYDTNDNGALLYDKPVAKNIVVLPPKVSKQTNSVDEKINKQIIKKTEEIEEAQKKIDSLQSLKILNDKLIKEFRLRIELNENENTTKINKEIQDLQTKNTKLNQEIEEINNIIEVKEEVIDTMRQKLDDSQLNSRKETYIGYCKQLKKQSETYYSKMEEFVKSLRDLIESNFAVNSAYSFLTAEQRNSGDFFSPHFINQVEVFNLLETLNKFHQLTNVPDHRL